VSPILLLEFRRGAHSPLGGNRNTTIVCDAWPVLGKTIYSQELNVAST